MSDLSDDMLQRYYDGELSEAEATGVHTLLADSDSETRRLDNLHQLHDALILASEDVCAEIDSDELFSRIEQGIAEDQLGKVLDLGRARNRNRRRLVSGAVFSLVAAAAAVLLFVGNPLRNARIETPVVTLDIPQAGSEVEQIDFGGNIGTVFAVTGLGGESLAVVWIDEEGDTQ